ncbi:hypothetical protein B0H12DRAFT_79101 [Mycena haematopus]|nr:hypothetical protein B0H12DRAFT_79101 [Mycena haematopus]
MNLRSNRKTRAARHHGLLTKPGEILMSSERRRRQAIHRWIIWPLTEAIRVIFLPSFLPLLMLGL